MKFVNETAIKKKKKKFKYHMNNQMYCLKTVAASHMLTLHKVHIFTML